MKEKRGRCLACRRPVYWEPWASGPVCYPCYWAAKLIYETRIERVEDIPPPLGPALEQIFIKRGYRWPDDLIRALKKRAFDKLNTEPRRWWSPRQQ